MKQFAIDCSPIQSPAQFWEAYISATRPLGASIFGRNLDAFHDALSGGPGYPGPCEISLLNSSQLGAIQSGRFLQALREIAEDPANAAVNIFFR